MAQIVYNLKKDVVGYSHLMYEHPEKIEHYHHNKHNEILIFVKGNCKMAVEGSEYVLNPYDIVIINSNELHRLYNLEPIKPYERFVWHISDEFFVRNECEEFKRIFSGRHAGEGNRISGELVKDNYIIEILNKLDEYVTAYDEVSEHVMRGKLMEILFHLNRLYDKNLYETAEDNNVRNIIMYINNHIEGKLSLDEISDYFFMSKSHICRMFKEHTGLSVHQYIKQKRLIRVKELRAEGMSLTDASIKAGFGSYSNFYKTYMNEMVKPPRKDLK